MSNTHKAILRAGLKGKGACPNVKAGERRQFQWRDTRDSSSDPLSDTIELIKHSENTIIVDHLCQEVGGYFIASKAMEDGSKCLHSNIAQLFEKLTGVVVTVTGAADDKIITNQEIKMIKESLNEFMEVSEQLVEAAEKGYWQ